MNIAISMIGDPDLILLDEPTTLMDPAGKRLLWNVIASCQSIGQSILMTSQRFNSNIFLHQITNINSLYQSKEI